MDKDDELKHST